MTRRLGMTAASVLMKLMKLIRVMKVMKLVQLSKFCAELYERTKRYTKSKSVIAKPCASLLSSISLDTAANK